MKTGRGKAGIASFLIGSLCLLSVVVSISRIGGMPVDRLNEAGTKSAAKVRGSIAPEKESVSTVVPKPLPMVDPRDDYDVQHYGLDLWLDLDGSVIGGGVTYQSMVTAVSLDTFVLDLFDNMTVDSAKIDGISLDYSHQDDQIRVALDRVYLQGEKLSPVVYYHGTPSYTGWARFRFSTHGFPPVPLVFSISWPDNSRGWWPCKDVLYDKATAEVRVTVPVHEHEMVVASIGTLTGIVDNPDTTRTYTWFESYPITTYNISFSTTNFELLAETYVGIEGDSLPIRHFVFPDDIHRAEESFSNLPAMMWAYENLFGEYPFMGEKYGMAEIQLNGAMEHQTMVSYGQSLIDGGHTFDMIVAHELAHMWFGNMITIGTWPDIWLSEGFATYAEALYEETMTGLQGYLDYMTSLDTGGFNDTVYDPDDLLSGTVYNKGAWILHMLRHVMDDSVLLETLRDFATDTTFMHGNAVTDDFIELCESNYGGDLGWYFEPWLNTVGRPNYYADWNSTSAGDEVTVEVRIDQTQSGETLYKMPLPIVFAMVSGETTFTVWDSMRTQNFEFELPEEPIDLRLDPDNWVLKFVRAPLEITTDSIPHGTVGEVYAYSLRSEGGVYPFMWTIFDGALPDSMHLNSGNGLISGVPRVDGEFEFQVEVRDGFEPPHADSSVFTLVVEPATGIEDGSITGSGIPRAYDLYQNYPNPFNPSTVIRFDVPGHGKQPVRLRIYDLRGRRVRTLLQGNVTPGRRSVHWDGRDNRGEPVPSGLYIYRFDSGDFKSARRMLLVR
jgi:hypothetical protein